LSIIPILSIISPVLLSAILIAIKNTQSPKNKIEANPEINIIVAGKFDVGDARLNIKNLKFVGFKNDYHLQKLIQGCEFVIVPSEWYENQPYSVLEAYACGKAVVASKIGGIPEIVKDGITGLLFNPKDANDFQNKILFLWSNRRIAKKMGSEARKYALTNFNSDDYYQKLIEIYNKVLK